MKANFDASLPVRAYVLDKATGALVAQYTVEGPGFWAWHSVNAWEDCETGDVHVDVTHDAAAASSSGR